jgi:hypothetical protein
MMKSAKIFLCCLALLAILTSCQPESPLTEETPEIDIINLGITPSLTHWLPNVAQCANAIPDFGIYVLPWIEPELDQADLILRLGERQETDPHVAIMGIEEITIVSGVELPVSTLSLESLQAIYSGSINNWREVPEVIEASIEINQPIQTLSYPKGHLLRLLFRNTVLQQQPISSNTLIFSTPEYLETLLQEYPYAIGFMLKSQVPEDVQKLTITNFNSQQAQQFVLAITSQEPTGKLRQLLLCLQDSQ